MGGKTPSSGRPGIAATHCDAWAARGNQYGDNGGWEGGRAESRFRMGVREFVSVEAAWNRMRIDHRSIEWVAFFCGYFLPTEYEIL